MKAIHDRYYSTPAGSFDELRWRLQLIAEEEVGGHFRRAQAREDAAAAQLIGKIDGSG